MRKMVFALGAAMLLSVASAVPALAASELPRPRGGGVLGKVVVHQGTAFTGANVAPWGIAIVALVLVGATLLLLGRRRGTAAG